MVLVFLSLLNENLMIMLLIFTILIFIKYVTQMQNTAYTKIVLR